MLYRHSEVFRSLMMLGDLALVALTWLMAYMIRFETGLEAPKGHPPLETYLLALIRGCQKTRFGVSASQRFT